MGINTQNINLGVCDVTFDGNDMGATKGGVEVQIKTSTHEVKVDQAGETPVKEIITGTTVQIKVPMAETDLNRMLVVMPQSVGTVAVAAPTGCSVNMVAGYAIGATAVKLTVGAGTPTPGQLIAFTGHTTMYRVVSWAAGTSIVTIAQALSGAGGLAAPLVNTEVTTFTASKAGVEIRSGVNIDLATVAKMLKLHPTGLSVLETASDFTVFKAAPSPNFTFKYSQGNERIYEVTFKGYVDTDNNNRLAAFGTAA